MKVLVAIKSCHKYKERRKAVIGTWLPALDWADYVFLIGRPLVDQPDVLSCNVSDDFADIAPKIWCACRYALQENIDHMFVCDDDTYVRPERLLKSEFAGHDYLGFLRTGGLEYNNNIPYAQGSAYWLSKRAMEHIATGTVMRPGIIDDGAVGQALIGFVPFTHDSRYEPGPVPDRRPRRDNSLVTTHKCLPDTMRRIHQEFTK